MLGYELDSLEIRVHLMSVLLVDAVNIDVIHELPGAEFLPGISAWTRR